MLTFLVALSTSALNACSIPVFRYALERWEADPYVIEVVHRGVLSGEARMAANVLDSYASGEKTPVNLTVHYVDIEKQMREGVNARPREISSPYQPQMVVYFPLAVRMRKPIWRGPLTIETVKKLVDSPLRKDIVRRLLDGESAVWIFLEIGNRKKDEAAAALLEKQLKLLQDTLKLPDDSIVGEENIPDSAVRIEFSIVRLSRDDPEEAFLAASLLRTESDLLDFNEPMAFPVFGRGRVLYAIIGKGINPNIISRACETIVGACSCQVKAENPGIDMLLSANWDEAIKPVIINEPPPTLIGITDLVVPEKTPSTVVAEADASPKTETEPGSGVLAPSVLIVLGAAIVIVIIGTLIMCHDKMKTEGHR